MPLAETSLADDVLHYPNLKTILMVEKVLREADGPLKREEIKRRLEKKVQHQTLNVILTYFREHNFIVDGHQGIVWIYNPSPKLDKAIEEGIEM